MVKIQHFKHRIKLDSHQNTIKKGRDTQNTVNLSELKAEIINQ